MNELYNALIEFHFLRPLWLLALLPLALLIVALWRSEGRSGEWSNIVDANLLPHLLVGRESKQSNTPIILLAVAWFLTVIALAGPTWKQLPQPVEQKNDPLVVMLDLSLSMKATDLTPSRLERAKHKLLDILRMREEGLTALLVYAGSAHVVTPMTDDTKTIQSLVPGLDPEIMPVAGSDFPAGLQRAVELLKAPEFPNGQILVITDGIEESDLEKAEDILDGTRYTLSVLGVGTLEGSPIPLENGAFVRDNSGAIVIPKLQRKTLRALASQHGGRYADLRPGDMDIKSVIYDDSVLSSNTREVKRKFDIWREEGGWLLILIVPLAALAFRRGWLNVVVLMILLPASQNSEASWWEDIWQTQDQQAYQKYQHEDYSGAAEQFKNPTWKGGAQYKNGDFEGALNNWQTQDKQQADPYYNRGNALARLGKLEDAIKSYDQALEINPDHEDAIHNKKIVEDMLKQQQDQQNQQGDSQDQNQDQNQDQQDQQQGDNQQQSDNQQSSDQQNDQNQQSDQQQQNSEQQSQQQNDQQSEDQAQKDEQQNQQSSEQQDAKESDEKQAQQQAKKEESSLEELHKQARKELTFQEEMTSDEQKEVERWLQRVPDDPGGLMRRKFLYESQKSQLQRSDMNSW